MIILGGWDYPKKLLWKASLFENSPTYSYNRFDHHQQNPPTDWFDLVCGSASPSPDVNQMCTYLWNGRQSIEYCVWNHAYMRDIILLPFWWTCLQFPQWGRRKKGRFARTKNRSASRWHLQSNWIVFPFCNFCVGLCCGLGTTYWIGNTIVMGTSCPIFGLPVTDPTGTSSESAARIQRNHLGELQRWLKWWLSRGSFLSLWNHGCSCVSFYNTVIIIRCHDLKISHCKAPMIQPISNNSSLEHTKSIMWIPVFDTSSGWEPSRKPCWQHAAAIAPPWRRRGESDGERQRVMEFTATGKVVAIFWCQESGGLAHPQLGPCVFLYTPRAWRTKSCTSWDDEIPVYCADIFIFKIYHISLFNTKI